MNDKFINKRCYFYFASLFLLLIIIYCQGAVDFEYQPLTTETGTLTGTYTGSETNTGTSTGSGTETGTDTGTNTGSGTYTGTPPGTYTGAPSGTYTGTGTGSGGNIGNNCSNPFTNNDFTPLSSGYYRSISDPYAPCSDHTFSCGISGNDNIIAWTMNTNASLYIAATWSTSCPSTCSPIIEVMDACTGGNSEGCGLNTAGFYTDFITGDDFNAGEILYIWIACNCSGHELHGIHIYIEEQVASSCPAINIYNTGIPFISSYTNSDTCTSGDPSYHSITVTGASYLCISGSYGVNSFDCFRIIDGYSAIIFEQYEIGTFYDIFVPGDTAIFCVHNVGGTTSSGYGITEISYD